MELPKEAIGSHEVLAEENEREQIAKKMPAPLLKKEKIERVPKQQLLPPTYVHADSGEKDKADTLSADADTGEVLDFDTV